MSDTKLLYTKEQIQTRVKELAQQLATEYHGKNPLIVGVLKGSFILLADLVRELYQQGLKDIEVDFLTISSYGTSTTSSGTPHILSDVSKDIAGRDVILVDDIFDTGHTLHFVQKVLKERNPSSLKTLVLLSKSARRVVQVPVEYIGFEIEGTPWVEGYGLDGGEFGRGRPDIAEKITK